MPSERRAARRCKASFSASPFRLTRWSDSYGRIQGKRKYRTVALPLSPPSTGAKAQALGCSARVELGGVVTIINVCSVSAPFCHSSQITAIAIGCPS